MEISEHCAGRIEALADAIAALNDASNPESEAYRLRNPGLLKSYTLRHPADEGGRRIFPSLINGYGALLYDLEAKCSGRSRSKLKATSSIRDLLVRGFSQPASSADLVLCFLQKALPDDHIGDETQIGFFMGRRK